MDYKSLNKITIKKAFSITTIDELFDELHGACYFSNFDLSSGFNQIRVSDDYIGHATFQTHEGHFEFLVMPFNPNLPSTFQATLNSIFKSYLRKFILVVFDDILIYSKDWASHL